MLEANVRYQIVCCVNKLEKAIKDAEEGCDEPDNPDKFRVEQVIQILKSILN